MMVSGNPEMPEVRDWALLLRAVATTVPATGLLYRAAAMLTSGRNAEARAYNRAILDLTAAMLGFTDDDPALVERVLRGLPDLD